MIQAFYNPTKEGDTFKGHFGFDNGRCADAVIRDLGKFLETAGRNYYIKKAPVFQRFGTGDVAGDHFAEVENQFHLVRSNDERVVSPHTVSEQYAPLSLMDMAEEVAPWIQAGWATPDAVFEARGGSLEVLVLRLDASGEVTDGEFFVHYIVLQNPHGSGGKAKGKIISFRIVCCNTFAAACGAASDFTITHRVAGGDPAEQQKIMALRAKEAVSAWDKVKEHIKELSDRINVWNSIPLQVKDAENLTNQLLGIKDAEDASTRSKNRRDAIVAAFSMPKMGTFGRTAYDWLNAVTFVNSSPFAEINKKSKVSSIDRAVRTFDPNGTGFKLEQDAEALLAELVA
jgi:hypothetical protein